MNAGYWFLLYYSIGLVVAAINLRHYQHKRNGGETAWLIIMLWPCLLVVATGLYIRRGLM